MLDLSGAQGHGSFRFRRSGFKELRQSLFINTLKKGWNLNISLKKFFFQCRFLYDSNVLKLNYPIENFFDGTIAQLLSVLAANTNNKVRSLNPAGSKKSFSIR